MAFQNLDYGKYFVSSYVEEVEAAQHFFEENSQNPDAEDLEVEIYDEDAHVSDEDRDNPYPRIIGFGIPPDSDEGVNLLYAFCLQDVRNMLETFEQNGAKIGD